ncbi:MAG: MBL fold metallo-hydrolase [Verrucomicrobia bacterium]|nr:MBL fold metallo-hydrolase [Verrucomicrobiota bacterium]
MSTEYLKLTESKAQTAHPGAARRTKFANSQLEVRMFNVGDGEAILIAFPNRRAWLVDGGSGNGNAKNQTLGQQLAAHLRQRNLTLEALIPSHPHKDHVGAVASLLAAGPPLTNPLTIYRSEDATWNPPSGWIKELKDVVANLPTPVNWVTLQNAHREISVTDGVSAHFFAGSGDDAYTSIFLQLRFHQAQLLFTGDSHCGYERDLLDSFGEADFRADVLKVTHHGSSSGTAQRVVNSVKPAIAIASTALDDGHRLEADTLQRLRNNGAQRRVFETVIDGDIILRTDGEAFGGGVLYQVELVAPGLFEAALGATTLPRATVDAARTTSPNHPECVAT